MKALRVFPLTGSGYVIRPDRRIERFARLAEMFDATFLRFAALPEFLGLDADLLCGAPICRQPGRRDGSLPFNVASDGG